MRHAYGRRREPVTKHPCCADAATHDGRSRLDRGAVKEQWRLFRRELCMFRKRIPNTRTGNALNRTDQNQSRLVIGVLLNGLQFVAGDHDVVSDLIRAQTNLLHNLGGCKPIKIREPYALRCIVTSLPAPTVVFFSLKDPITEKSWKAASKHQKSGDCVQ